MSDGFQQAGAATVSAFTLCMGALSEEIPLSEVSLNDWSMIVGIIAGILTIYVQCQKIRDRRRRRKNAASKQR